MGYHRAGFDVVGVDMKAQPRYPFEFYQGDAMTWPLDGFDAIHASPPCQFASIASAAHRKAQPKLFVGLGEKRAKDYPDLLTPTRERLRGQNAPWVIENVPRAPMTAHAVLCGCMFEIGVYRERWFECSWPLLKLTPPHHHVGIRPSISGNGTSSWYREKSGVKSCLVADLRIAMGIDWMSRKELSQAIPPAYTFWIGKQLIRRLNFDDAQAVA